MKGCVQRKGWSSPHSGLQNPPSAGSRRESGSPKPSQILYYRRRQSTRCHLVILWHRLDSVYRLDYNVSMSTDRKPLAEAGKKAAMRPVSKSGELEELFERHRGER